MKDNTAADARFAADSGAVRAALGVARGFAEEAGLEADASAKLCIIVEELIGNIVEHGAPPPGSEIALGLTLSGPDILLSLSDAGPPFDPRDTEIAAIPERGGGAGLSLIRAWVSAFDYERRDGRNVVTLTIRPERDDFR